MKDNTKVSNKVAEIRGRRGIAAAKLAQEVGVSRQTIYALEAGTYVPNTLVGLRLARALGVTVEDLFSLAENLGEGRTRVENVTLIPRAERILVGEPVRLCEVDGKLIAAPPTPSLPYLAEMDGKLVGRSRVSFDDKEINLQNRLLLAGCDPAMAVLARYLQPLGIDVVLVHENSSKSLELLQKGLVHMAGTHFQDASSGESNVGVVNRKFKGGEVAIISFAVAEEGIVTAAGNPKGIKGMEDLGRRDVKFVNREVGSGSRHLLESRMKDSGMEAKEIRGFDSVASGHLAAAAEVKAARVDCCLATGPAARAFGLGFIPVASVRYDFVVRQRFLSLPGIQTLMEALGNLRFRRKLENAGGYEVGVSGRRVM